MYLRYSTLCIKYSESLVSPFFSSMTKGFYKLSESLSPSIFRQKRGSYMRRSKLVVLLWSIECQEQDILPLSCFYIRTSSATLCVAPKHLESHSHAASRTTELIFSEMQFLVRCCDRWCRRGRCGTSRSRRHHNIDPRGLRHPGVLQPAPPPPPQPRVSCLYRPTSSRLGWPVQERLAWL